MGRRRSHVSLARARKEIQAHVRPTNTSRAIRTNSYIQWTEDRSSRVFGQTWNTRTHGLAPSALSATDSPIELQTGQRHFSKRCASFKYTLHWNTNHDSVRATWVSILYFSNLYYYYYLDSAAALWSFSCDYRLSWTFGPLVAKQPEHWWWWFICLVIRSTHNTGLK